MTILGENLKKYRLKANLSIEALSKISGVGRSTIGDIEIGKAKNPRMDTLTRLATSLNITVQDLSEMEEEEEYKITDIEEAFNLFLSQEDLALDGEKLSDEAKLQLENSIKMSLEFVRNVQAMQKNKR